MVVIEPDINMGRRTPCALKERRKNYSAGQERCGIVRHTDINGGKQKNELWHQD